MNPEESNSIQCPSCKFRNKDTHRFCEACGTDLSPAKPIICQYCLRPITRVAKFCPHCGKRITLGMPALCRVTMHRQAQYSGSVSPCYISVNGSTPQNIGVGKTLFYNLPIGNYKIVCKFKFGKPMEYNVHIDSDYTYKIHIDWSCRAILHKV